MIEDLILGNKFNLIDICRILDLIFSVYILFLNIYVIFIKINYVLVYKENFKYTRVNRI